MDRIVNDFTINIATANGTGSQSANLILLQSLFDMGVPVSGKNLFPSNISGLPTWYIVRLSDKGYQQHPAIAPASKFSSTPQPGKRIWQRWNPVPW